MLAALLVYESRLARPQFVLHRRQLLLIEKTALLYCPEKGQDAFRDRSGHFGLLLLMANDHFHYARPSSTHQELEANVLTEFVAVNEFSGSRVQNTVTRARIMRNEIAPSLKGAPNYVDLNARFCALTGISLDLFEQLCMALFTKYSVMTLEQLKESGDNLYLQSHWFRNMSVTSEQVARFVNEIGATDAEYQKLFSQKRHFGHNDFTAIKDRPVYLHPCGGLPLDLLFMAGKFATGPFWRIHNAMPTGSEREGFRSFWGRIFEEYLNRLMQRACQLPYNRYIPNPTFTSNDSEACDAMIVREDVAIVFEYKASMFTAVAKYSGSASVLLDEIKHKLIESEEGKSKGVTQIAATANKLFSDNSVERLNEVDVSKITKLYPVLVTLDDIGGSFLMSKHLGDAFREACRETAFREDLKIMPFFSLNVEALEMISGYLGSVPLDLVLEEWLQRDPGLMSSMFAVDHPLLVGGRNKVLDEEFKRIWDRLMRSLGEPETETEIEHAQESIARGTE
ncbi:MAG TPA: hypothetical protein VJ723_05910 [Candidatus Angelobacter sp.]|nr:hypothetical protein [Candidatus Angelobacter sp.]